MNEEDQLVDTLLPTAERPPEEETPLEESPATEEESGLESSPPQEVKWSDDQMRELKEAISKPHVEEPPKEEPAFDEAEFRQQVGYSPIDPLKLQRLYDLDVPSEEKQQIMDEFQRNTFEASVRAANFIAQKDVQDLRKKAEQFERIEQQRVAQQQAQQVQQLMHKEHPVTEKFPEFAKMAAMTISQEVSSGQRKPYGQSLEGIRNFNKEVAARVTSIGKEHNLDMTISTQKKTPPPNLGGGQAGQPAGGGKPPTKEKSFEERAWERTKARLNIK